MIRLLVLAIFLLVFSAAYGGDKGAERGSGQDHYREMQQHKRAIDRHARETGVRDHQHRQKQKDTDEADDKDSDSPKDKKPQ